MAKRIFLYIKCLCSLILLAYSTEVYSQNISKLDSLKKSLLHENSNQNKIVTYLRIYNYYSNIKLDSSEFYLNKIFQLATETKNDTVLDDLNFQYGCVCFLKGDYYHSMEYFYKYLDLIKDSPTAKYKIGACISNIANIFYLLEDYNKALENYKIALKTFEKSNNTIYSALKVPLINNIANIYDVKGKKDSAIYFYREGRLDALKLKDFENLSKIENNLGDIYLETNKPDSAYKYLRSAFVLRKNQNDSNGLVSSYKNLGIYFYKVNQTDSAILFLEKSVELSRMINELYNLNETLGTLQDIYAQKGDYKKAYATAIEFKSTADSLFNERNVKKITALELNYKFQNELQKKELLENKRKTRFTVVLITLVFFVLIMSLLYRLALSKTKREKLLNKNLSLEKENLELANLNLNQSLEIKNKELTTNVLYLIKKNELIASISKKLLELKGTIPGENQKSLQQIIYDLKRGSDVDVWNEFEIRFQNVHLDFYKRLEEKFPDLSINEKKLCAFIRLRMNSKEISSILHINLKSVIVARTRLRKRLNITNTDIDLENFLAEF